MRKGGFSASRPITAAAAAALRGSDDSANHRGAYDADRGPTGGADSGNRCRRRSDSAPGPVVVLFTLRAVRVSEAAEADAVARAFLRKYVGLEVDHAHALQGAPPPGDDRAEVWTWRIDPLQGAS